MAHPRLVHGCGQAAALLALLCALHPAPARAQLVQGTLVDARTGSPLNGGVIFLLDSAAVQRDGGFTNAQGRFTLRVSVPGRYRVRVLRIGYQPALVPVTLGAGDIRPLRVELQPSTVRLSEIRVTGTQRCVVHPERGAATARLWESVRTALSATVLTSTQRHTGLRIATFERHVDAGSGTVRWSRRAERLTYSETPFVSIPIDRLDREGYVIREGEGWQFRAPDAHVLLSERFLEAHCFRLQQPPEGDSLIGLAFEPAAGRTLSDVNGVLWVDRESAELRHVEFGYTGLDLPIATDRLGGRIDFQRLPTGHWIVSRWVIRMPRIVQRTVPAVYGMPATTTHRLDAIHEAGGEVIELLADRVRTRRTGRIVGSVHDSTRGAPLAGAEVFVSGTVHTTRTDSAGAFLLEEVPPGEHDVSFLHPRLDSLHLIASVDRAPVLGDDTAVVRLAVPSWRTLRHEVCGDSIDPAQGVVRGVARDAERGTPIVGARVVITWTNWRIAERAATGERHGFEGSTDEAGRYLVCGIPGGRVVRAELTAEGYSPLRTDVRVIAGEMQRLDLSLRRR